MAYLIHDELGYCLVGDRYVLLDLAADRYLCLSEAAGAAFHRVLAGRSLSPEEEARLDPLIRADYLCPIAGPDRSVPPRSFRAPTSSILDVIGDARFARHLGASAMGLMRAALALRRRPLAQTLRQLPHAPAQASADDTTHRSDFLERVAAFAVLDLLISPHDRCLPRSIALTRSLRQHGHDVDLVFGVALNPFSAHCWVQQGETVLNDRADHVSRFTPILAR